MTNHSDTEQSTVETESSDDESPNDPSIESAIANAMQNEKHEHQKSILNFVTPNKQVLSSKSKSANVTKRSPPTPAEEPHAKSKATKKVKNKSK
ncbi:hypothetical protein DPMN_007756 [Dreissena polymorpha]|uniref:Uncharacterized protein n=1 Tax=Dreissena polymorpha TaxID=45954 RepID=A0A9D4MU57_DREPO|nr:hypothetical protein DPMN_007756 [Dreissena polymorpha]